MMKMAPRGGTELTGSSAKRAEFFALENWVEEKPLLSGQRLGGLFWPLKSVPVDCVRVSTCIIPLLIAFETHSTIPWHLQEMRRRKRPPHRKMPS